MESNNDVNNEDVLKDWTQSEKYELLQALKEFGSRDIDQISLMICSKSKNEVQAAVEYYKKKALDQEKLISFNRKIRQKTTPYVPLSSWAKLISDHHNFDDLQTDTAAALRIIAEFEDRPPPSCTEKIDFKRIYNIMADALEGKSLPENKYIKSVIDTCIVETALTSRAFFKSTAYRQVLKSINMTEKKSSHFPNPDVSHELTNLRHLADQTNYNPLNIPEYYLKSSIT